VNEAKRNMMEPMKTVVMVLLVKRKSGFHEE